MDDIREKGLQLFAEIMGPERAEQFRLGLEQGGISGAMTGFAADFAFGSIWARDGLERAKRSLVVIGVLIAQRQTAELKNHFRIGLANGLAPREIEEAVIQSLPYVGFPAAAGATSALIEVFREQGLDTTSLTSHERGLL